MLLAAAPYFQQRFNGSPWISSNFQSSILTVFTVTNLLTTVVLANFQSNDAYPRRIKASAWLNLAIFALLSFSTVVLRETSAPIYFTFLLLMIFGTSLATGLSQNGLFSYVGAFEQPRHMQGIMVGQAVAGVLPCLVQIALSLQGDATTTPSAAAAFFLTAALVAGVAAVAFARLHRRAGPRFVAKGLYHREQPGQGQGYGTAPRESDAGQHQRWALDPNPESHDAATKIPLTTLFLRLRYSALALFLAFAVTMVFPVYTNTIQSVHAPNEDDDGGQNHLPRLLRPAVFIPIALLCWNTGDLAGRLLLLLPRPACLDALGRLLGRNGGSNWSRSQSQSQTQPRSQSRWSIMLLVLAVARVLFIPLYASCNVRGRGALVHSDWFYLAVVQGLFGLSNGYVASASMMSVGELENEEKGEDGREGDEGEHSVGSVEEQEAAGGFMSMMLVAGLAVGSVFSFLVE